MVRASFQTDPLLQFLAKVEISRDHVRQRGIHPSFEIELGLFEQARAVGYAEGRVERDEGGQIHFFRARITTAGELALQSTGWVV